MRDLVGPFRVDLAPAADKSRFLIIDGMGGPGNQPGREFAQRLDAEADAQTLVRTWLGLQLGVRLDRLWDITAPAWEVMTS